MELPVTPRDMGNGVRHLTLASWSQFNQVIEALLEHTQYVFRGQGRNDWLLEPTLTRLIKRDPDTQSARKAHLTRFRYAVRGRRGPRPAKVVKENELWAIGQHNGLATPLLDWTSSPYVALFFAFADPHQNDATDTRVVWMLNERRVRALCIELRTKDATDEIIAFYRPLSDENYRLVSQAGLFTSTPGMFDIETWMHVKKVTTGVHLVRVEIPNGDRNSCLTALNRMNINHASLFPDINGAALFANMALGIKHY